MSIYEVALEERETTKKRRSDIIKSPIFHETRVTKNKQKKYEEKNLHRNAAATATPTAAATAPTKQHDMHETRTSIRTYM